MSEPASEPAGTAGTAGTAGDVGSAGADGAAGAVGAAGSAGADGSAGAAGPAGAAGTTGTTSINDISGISDIPEKWPVETTTRQLDTWLLSVRTDLVRFPDNHSAERIVATHPGAVAVVALDDDDRVLMIRQYRHPVGYLLWEIPAGLRDKDGEPLADTARRELTEETGYTARDWHVLTDYFTSPGFSTERLRIFLARGLQEAGDTGFEREHEEKYLEFGWLPLAEAVRLVLAGKIHNSAAVTGILAAHAARAGGFASLRPVDSPET